MAATSKDALKAAAAYRAATVDTSVEDLVGELAVKMGEWTRAQEARAVEVARLRNAEVAAEDAVVAAYEAARGAGAKVKALEAINLKPTAAIAAVAKRAKESKDTKSAARPASSVAPFESGAATTAESLTAAPSLVGS